MSVANTTLESTREEMWREKLAVAFANLQTRLIDREDPQIEGDLTVRRFDDVRLYGVSGNTQVVYRTALATKRDPNELVKISLQVQGRAVVDQFDTAVEIQPGEFAIYDTSRAYSLALFGPWRTLVMTVPRKVLRIPDNQLKKMTAHPFPATTGAGALLTAYLREGIRQPECVESAENVRIRDAGLSLLEGTLAGHGPRIQGELSAAVRTHAVEFIRANLTDPLLSPAMVAVACQMSARSLHRVFEGSGVTVADFIRSLRLEAVRRDLENPVFDNKTIAAIAARWCIFDQSWLSRAFKAKFELTPSTYRSRHLAGKA